MGDQYPLEELHFTLNHVFFPPQLPQKSDASISRSFALCRTFVNLAEEYDQHLDQPSHNAWDHIITMLRNYQDSLKMEDFVVEDLEEVFQYLAIGGFLILHIRKQNAGLFIRRLANGDVSIASFEVSFPNAEVMQAESRIACTYPGPAITLPSSVWLNTSFSHELANFLYHMNRDELNNAEAHTKKAKSTVVEIRDVPDPKYISELLMGIFHGIGSPTPIEDVHFVRKRIADDVLWRNALLPWRRSPVYLVLRVGLQLALCYLYGSLDAHHHQYKAFMAFAHARMLHDAVQDHPELETDLLYAMRTKVARRVHKLEKSSSGVSAGDSVPSYVLTAAQEASNAVQQVLQDRWTKVERLQDQSPEWDPDSLDLEADTHLLLKNARPRILEGLRRSNFPPPSSPFVPQHPRRLRYEKDFRCFTPAKLNTVFTDDARVALADFEYVIHTRLGLWTKANLMSQDASRIIFECMEAYLSGARRTYTDNNPEDQSHMLLALSAMWVSLDKVAVAQLPLLAQYSPEITTNLLESLLLRQTNELSALRDIVQYITERHTKAQVTDGIFTDSDGDSAFYQQYFHSSYVLQSLKEMIENDASTKREECRRLLQERNDTYHTLMDRAGSLAHVHPEIRRYKKKRWRIFEDTSNCSKCSLEKQAKKIPDINVHEWPLPSNSNDAKRVCFELSCPESFERWRAATWLLLYDVGTEERRNKAQQYGVLPGSYPILRRSPPVQFTLATSTKSFKISHYKTRPIPARESDVFVNCGSTWKLYDISTECWAANQPFLEASFLKMCTPSATGPYASLNFSLEGTSHTSNMVIAAQADCHPDLSLHEFVAFGSLRSGGRLQWMNIARELVAGDLSFHCESVHALLVQAALQVGSWEVLNDGHWVLDWHQELENEVFTSKLLTALENLMLAISTNWDAVVSLRGVILLTCRILSGNQPPYVEDQGYCLLRYSRQIAMEWIAQLKPKLSSANEDHGTILSMRLCEIAATCRATYSGDPAHSTELLQNNDDISTFIYCAAIIHENTPSKRGGLSKEFCRLLDRDERLAVSVYDHLNNLSTKSCAGVDQAVSLLWPAYRPYGSWERLGLPNERWLETKTAPSSFHGISQRVHLNLLDGQLLIEGKPVGRLPRKITDHALYTRCLQQKILEVIPSDMPGMEYATRNLVFGSEIHFASQNTDDLVIRTRQNNQISELIPHNYFDRDLPRPLVKDYVHWLRIPQEIIELCPLRHPWFSSSSNNYIANVVDLPCMVMGDQRLIDPRSRTACMINLQLEPLEYADEIIIGYPYLTSVDPSLTSVVTINLPRFHSEFFLKDRYIQSKNIPGFRVDHRKSTGTFFGLRNQLVLRSMDMQLNEIRVLVPYGIVQVQKSLDHVTVEIDHHAKSPATYYEYLVNTDLGHLESSTSLTARLYKVYLHAVTSGRLPDPLTGRTGTEEALLEYSSASCITFLDLENPDRELLASIHGLSPERTFYPKNLEVMQSILWQPADLAVPPLSMHSAFPRITHNILEYAQKMSLFHPDRTSGHFTLYSESSPLLLRKAELREALFHSPDLQGIGNFNWFSQDRSYVLRSIRPANPVLKTSQQISHSYTEGLFSTEFPNLYTLFKEWNSISPASKLDIDISYNEHWLTPSFGKTWFSTANLLRKQGPNAHYQALFTFAAMAYESPQVNIPVISTFLAFGIDSRFQVPHFSLPKLSSPCTSYNLEYGLEPTLGHIKDLAFMAAHSMDSAPWGANDLSQHESENDWVFLDRINKDYEHQRDQLALEITRHYWSCWPTENLHPPPDPILSRLFDMSSLHKSMTNLFVNCFQNMKLSQFLQEVQVALQTIPSHTFPLLRTVSLPEGEAAHSSTAYLQERIMLKVLLNQMTPPQRDANGFVNPDTQKLGNLLKEFAQSPKMLLQLYGEQLDASRLALRSMRIDETKQDSRYCQSRDEIISCLNPRTGPQLLLQQAGQWPRLTMRTLLRQLSLEMRKGYPLQWQHVLTSLACELLHLQRARRLLEFQRSQSPHYIPEVEAIPTSFVDAKKNPEWVLIQVESHFTLRPLQHTVLHEMIYPSSSQNTVFQLNMGEGKSSVIAPLAVATMADQRTLVRLVVLKPLARQMFHLLAARLTGLCGRRIFYLPFSRSVDMGPTQIENVRSLLQECVDVGGILIAQPEHILSFRLLTVERLIKNDRTGPTLLELQKWLSQCSRDILDESDEILHSKYQLIYTMGNQQPLEDHPDRWTTIQQVFSLVLRHLKRLKDRFPMDIEVLDNEPGSFPSLRLLKPAPGATLVEWLADDIMTGRLETIHFGFLESKDQEAVRKFVTCFDVDNENVAIVKRCFESSGKWGSVLLLRGLLGQGLLAYVLTKRRWRVDYGLDLKRSLLAVPYRAKDVPSLNAEFGHPDIALLLTCLSYYYQGLNKDQLLAAFQLLLNSDNTAAEYEAWIMGLDLPAELRQETGINLEDPTQLTEILLPRFHQAKRVIDFYLSAVVFPKAAKEFPNKLSTSAWDLAEKSKKLKTGFSGTNDNRYLLPTTMQQQDIPGQESTSARVLSYLQQPENGPCISPDNFALEYVSLQVLLSHVASLPTPVRVLFDVGAQVLEVNLEVAKMWLEIDSQAQAAVYFDDKDEVSVLTRDGSVEPFIFSSFRNRLGECVVYLDDAHTRGTDLKFPREARALVTLGEKIPRTACMRLRQLGHGQSVLFFAPLEIARTIRADADKSDGDIIEVIDILRWAMLRTCEDIEHHIPHWVQQGVDFHERNLAWTAAKESGSPSDLAELSSAWLRPEARTLEQLYLPHPAQTAQTSSSTVAKAHEIPEIQAQLDLLGIMNVGDASVDEEQEREVAQEVEQERQLERPPPSKALDHKVRDEVRSLVRTGNFNPSSFAFLPLFDAVPLVVRKRLRQGVSPWSKQLWTTRDFEITIKNNSSKEHMRPVNWLLSTRPTLLSAMNIIILSPYEVQVLLPEIRKSTNVSLHIYSPRIRREMHTFEDLKFFCIPSLESTWSIPDTIVISQINLFSGQLYFANYDVYRNLCAFLGMGVHFEGRAGPVMDTDGFVRPAARSDTEIQTFYTGCPFVVSPVPFLQELTGLRRKGNKFFSTHMGKVVHGRFLTEQHFD
ncbi:hypothetical protein C8R41DRAFT_923340 [Lentinula lateritia]|uniref:ubiquitinyl hydrolase 1 n=1 Tax=Lentinula lateritia TaxID=40482 RepID=A0ABQ8V6F1_9AGAR|nr:hypothetical protein C8R41DRAFT_923340 [Lentinula lateritia]